MKNSVEVINYSSVSICKNFFLATLKLCLRFLGVECPRTLLHLYGSHKNFVHVEVLHLRNVFFTLCTFLKRWRRKSRVM